MSSWATDISCSMVVHEIKDERKGRSLRDTGPFDLLQTSVLVVLRPASCGERPAAPREGSSVPATVLPHQASQQKRRSVLGIRS